MSNCFFIGHRDSGNDIFPLLLKSVERHITEYSVTDFYVGHYGRFDTMAAQAVKDAKKHHPQVTLTLLPPYHPYDRPIPTAAGFDGTYYPPDMEAVPKRFAIVQANHRMVDSCQHLIAYARSTASSTGKLVEYAKQREKRGLIRVENLWE